MITCLICNELFDNSNKFRSHLRYKHEILTKDYYDTYLRKPGEGICPVCGSPTTFKGLTKGGYYQHCCTKCSSLDPNVQAKNKKTNLERYGAENVYASEYGKSKIKQTMLKRYNVEYPLQDKEIAQQAGKKQSETKQSIKEQFLLENDVVTKQFLTDKYGWSWYWDNVIQPIQKEEQGFWVNYYRKDDIPKIEAYIEETIHNNRSHIEMELLRYVQSIYTGTIKHDCKNIISPKEIDIYLPDLKLGIEFNGSYWHSVEMDTPKDYHLDKSLRCREKGIRLIHIYEFEDFEKQKQLLRDLINGIDNYPKQDFNKNNLIDSIPEPEIIHQENGYTIYGAGKLF